MMAERIETLGKSDLRLAYRAQRANASDGRAAELLYLGGLASDMFGTKASQLALWAEERGYDYTRFDYRGHGQSAGKFTDFGIDHWAEDALRVIDQVCEKPVILLGSSLGGWIGALVAKARPERIAGYIGIAAAPDFVEREFWPQFSDAQKNVIAEGGIVELPSDYPEPYYISAALIEGGMRSSVMNAPLAMPFPVRILQGMRDETVSIATALAFAEHIGADDLRLELIKNGDHGLSDAQSFSRITAAIDEIQQIFAQIG